jgi:hypothetical protein
MQITEAAKNHNFLNKYHCQESTIVSGEKVSFFQSEDKAFFARRAPFALLTNFQIAGYLFFCRTTYGIKIIA